MSSNAARLLASFCHFDRSVPTCRDYYSLPDLPLPERVIPMDRETPRDMTKKLFELRDGMIFQADRGFLSANALIATSEPHLLGKQRHFSPRGRYRKRD
jgi:hypothetical protein